MTIPSGTRLGAFEITGKLGEGGMGEVYRATDSKLRRDVAIKVLPAAFAEDPERLARFEREARLLAQLQHANIAAIYGFEDAGGVPALVIELVEGPTLDQHLENGTLPLEETLTIAQQIAEALEEAHEKGIIHRDLKPQNIKITADGKVKVLDFGLAKAMDPEGTASGEASASQLAASPTLTIGATMQGVILGTAGYMAPEQAKGSRVDKRADIWAFGVVLYEMLTGSRLFAGDSVPETLAEVLKTEIDFESLPHDSPPAIRRLLRRCLERSPKNRLHDIADARIMIEEMLSGTFVETRPTAEAASTPPSRARLAATTGLIAALCILGGWLLPGSLTREAKPGPVHLSLVPPEELVLDNWDFPSDGSALFFRARQRDDPKREYALYRRELGAAESSRVPGTEGVLEYVLTPDSHSIVFTQPEPADPTVFRLLRIPGDGSQPPVEIAPWDPSWTSFSVLIDGEIIVLAEQDRLHRIGGQGSQDVAVDVGRSAQFFFEAKSQLVGDHRLLLTADSWSGRGYQRGTALVDPRDGQGSVLIEDGAGALYVQPGRLLFARGSTLLGKRLDLETGRVKGQPVALLEGLRIGEAWQTGDFSYSRDGTLVYAPGGLVGAERRFVVLDPETGSIEPWSDVQRAFVLTSPEPSVDGRYVYAQLANAAGTYEIWRIPRSGPIQPVIALSEADASLPRLSPDGRTIAFRRYARQPSDGIYAMPIDRSAPPREIFRRPDEVTDLRLRDWTPDGHFLLANGIAAGANSILELSVETPGESRTLVSAPARDPSVSPDGLRLAFISNASGRDEIYVANYPSSGAVGERVAVSREGGSMPAWSPDGGTLYFADRADRILAVPFGSDGRPAGEPEVAIDRDPLRTEVYNVLPDGRLLFIMRGPREDEIRQLAVILHFDRILEERLP